MSDLVRLYVGHNIEITYDDQRCIHASECVRGLPAVFDRVRRPWIQADGATADAIATVIAKCPSGALHFARRDGGDRESLPESNSITVTHGGPLYIRGRVQLKMANGSEIVNDQRLALCRCGGSRNKPFCDNSHLNISFDEPAPPVAAEAGRDDGD